MESFKQYMQHKWSFHSESGMSVSRRASPVQIQISAQDATGLTCTCPHVCLSHMYIFTLHLTDALLHCIPQLRVMRKAPCSHPCQISLLNPLVVESEGVRPVDAEPQMLSI